MGWATRIYRCSFGCVDDCSVVLTYDPDDENANLPAHCIYTGEHVGDFELIHHEEDDKDDKH